jgi:hypothetical protein
MGGFRKRRQDYLDCAEKIVIRQHAINKHYDIIGKAIDLFME